MIAQVPMPRTAYLDAAAALKRANPRDGEALIAAGEASLRSGMATRRAIPLLVEGLSHQPSYARGWLLLSQASLSSDHGMAVRALSQALVLGPRDYWLMGIRAQEAALLWRDLDPELQDMAFDQVRMLWQEPLLRGQLRQLLRSPEGVALAARAFAGRDEEVRDMNRWLAAERRKHHG